MKIQKIFSIMSIIFISACVNYQAKINALTPGMTKQEVVNIMGNPHYKTIDGKKEKYCYKRCGVSGGAVIRFDENGLLNEAY